MLTYFCGEGMTELIVKSNQNARASLHLFDNHKVYAPVIHCAYYSCVQRILHILLTLGGKTEQDIKGVSTRGSLHTFLIDEMRKLIQKQNPASFKTFSKISDLRTLRVKSDYLNVSVDYDDADKATRIAQQINDTLDKTFKV